MENVGLILEAEDISIYMHYLKRTEKLDMLHACNSSREETEGVL